MINRVTTLFLAIFCLSLPHSLRSQEQETRHLFARAYSLFSVGNLSQAEEIFRKTLGQKFPLEDYSLYFLGVISSARGQFESSRQYFSQLKGTFPRSVWSQRAEIQLARLSMAETNYLQAIARLQALRSQKIKKEISDEALHLLGLLHELLGQPTQAHSLYQELRRASPLSPWAAMARKAVRRLREQQSHLFGLSTVEAISAEGELLVREREYREAEREYRRLLDLVPQGSLRPRFLTGLADLLRAARKREEAIPFLSEIIDRHPNSGEAPAALYRLAEIYWNRDENTKALDHFTQLRERYPKSPFHELAHFASARIYESLGKPAEAIRFYREFSKIFPTSSLREETHWRLAWIRYLQGDYDRAHAAFRRLAADKGEGRYKIPALYWQARTALRTGRFDEAKQYFSQILNVQEESYYKGPAARWLETMGVAVGGKKTLSSDLVPQTAPSLSAGSSFHLSRAHELTLISLNQMAIAELDEIRDSTNNDLGLKLMLIRRYAENGAYARSVVLASQNPHAADEWNRYRYPLVFWEAIQRIARERILDPHLVLALIRQESMFDPKALSPASAFGLMQLLPSTAIRAAAHLGIPPPEPEKLYEPELNLTLGTYHLKELLRRYSNNLVKAIAAYNAGENAVARWEKQLSAEDEDEFIERIPYSETRNYVKLVLRNHRVYRMLYDSQR